MGHVSVDNEGSVSISGSADVDYLLVRSWSNADISGGNVGLLVTSLFPIGQDASLTISAGHVDQLHLSLNLYGDTDYTLTQDAYASGFSAPGVDIAAGTVGTMRMNLGTYGTSHLGYAAGATAEMRTGNTSRVDLPAARWVRCTFSSPARWCSTRRTSCSPAG